MLKQEFEFENEFEVKGVCVWEHSIDWLGEKRRAKRLCPRT